MYAPRTAENRRFVLTQATYPWTAVLLSALLYAGFNAYYWDRAWDDMAITLGFARTLADTGMIAPTPLSDPVEGTSSLLWMALNAAIYKLHGDAGVLFAQAKLLSIALLLLDVAMVFAVAVACGVSRLLAFIISLTFAGCYPTIVESVNGMENPLYAFVYCVSFISYLKVPSKVPFIIFLVSSSAILFVRWEGLWFLLPFAFVNWWRFGLRGLFAVQHWIWLCLFAGQTVWRLLAFGDLVPNTIRAKAQLPYWRPAGDLGDLIVQHIFHLRQEIAAKPFIIAAIGVIVVALVLGLLRRRKDIPSVWQILGAVPLPVLLAAAIVIAGGIFATVTGGNWGHKGRMFFIALPFLLVCAGWGVERVSAAVHIPARSVVLVFAVAAAITVVNDVRRAHRYLSRSTITVAEMARILPALESAKRLTGRSTLVVAHPDLGALLLFGNGFRIVDTALLCNGRLARKGYDAFEDEIFVRERPDIIQTHEVWTTVSRIAEKESLYTDYAPIFLNGVRLFMRRDLLARIPAHKLQQRRFARDGSTGDYDRSLFWTKRSRPADFAINRRFGYYWAPTEEIGRGRSSGSGGQGSEMPLGRQDAATGPVQ